MTHRAASEYGPHGFAHKVFGFQSGERTSDNNAYNLSNGSYGTFEQLSEGGYLDYRFNVNKPLVRDYVLTMTVSSKTPGAPSGAYSCNASPGMGATAGRYFYIGSDSSDIHVNAKQPATAADEILQP